MALDHQHHHPEQSGLLNFLVRVSQQLEFLLQNKNEREAKEEAALEKGADFISLTTLDRQLVQYHQHEKLRKMISSTETTTIPQQASGPWPLISAKFHHHLIDRSYDYHQAQLASVAIHPLNQAHYSYQRNHVDPHFQCSAEQHQQQQQFLIQDASYADRGDGSSAMLSHQTSSMDSNYPIPPLLARMDYQTTDCACCCWLAKESFEPANSTIPLDPICYSTGVTYDHYHNHHSSGSSSSSYNHIHYSRWDQRQSVP